MRAGTTSVIAVEYTDESPIAAKLNAMARATTTARGAPSSQPIALEQAMLATPMVIIIAVRPRRSDHEPPSRLPATLVRCVSPASRAPSPTVEASIPPPHDAATARNAGIHAQRPSTSHEWNV